ncbi:MAG: tRNA pseudouridine(54/55) synthase Pus10 [Nitrososphaerota archaeon]|jgi:tRNA pseudouridine synthase 10|uniref:tRNA pseudouridine(54/55) synthase Pus10 n=1 Tax=Candidatus Bathycorpusculum sp. TaxID=2994959 RepID=UPI002827CF8A|nr:tRNA pseudouridine(54/55) synthase Pus10 [Candidatus Termitimicrobium sp.]MCL2431379.1 tRNA pseudouridine(54/55) synthase Pus10 [Candidatus Termitimicrobium sp.]MDR0492069.1 tRNA pseudouridine(54/55) synthase Pus10 [Nitrososphaerota archaeon]
MDILEKSYDLLSKYPLCDHCLGRQFASLGYNMENNVRGAVLKTTLTMQANESTTAEKNIEGIKCLKILATNGFSATAQQTLEHLKKRISKQPDKCHLCEGKFELVNNLIEKTQTSLQDYEFTTFLVGIELPTAVEEREDEFKAAQNIQYGESIRHEFGRVLGKALAKAAGKEAEYLKPDIVVIINPFEEKIRLQINPLFVGGRYRKLVRTIPQSEWLCSCRGKGCVKCSGTGKLYPESVEAYTSKPVLEAAKGEESFFHASGREDIDARMLGTGRPFIVEISKPKLRSVDLKQIEAAINAGAVDKVEVSELNFASKDDVRHLKRGESAQKEYRLLAEFEKDLADENLRLIEQKLSGTLIRQQTPLRVVHRRADIVRERYIYKLEVKKVTLKRALLLIRCQGGLYVKELVSGDEGRTVPNVSALLDNPAKTLKLDVLNVIME